MFPARRMGELSGALARRGGKRIPGADRRTTGKEKDDILGHEAENLLDISLQRGAHPVGNDLTNLLLLLFVVHKVAQCEGDSSHSGTGNFCSRRKAGLKSLR